MLNAARAYAYVAGRDYVVPEDIKILAPVVWAHRIVLQTGDVYKRQVQSVVQSFQREITLDALCMTQDGRYCNVEVQKGNSNDDIRRTRFHASFPSSGVSIFPAVVRSSTWFSPL